MTGPRLVNLIAIAATSSKGERIARAIAAMAMSKILGMPTGGECGQADQGRRKRGVLCTRATEDADMRRPQSSPGALRLLPAPAGAVAEAVPEADGDRGGRQRVVAGDPEGRDRDGAAEQRGGDEGELEGEGEDVEPAVA